MLTKEESGHYDLFEKHAALSSAHAFLAGAYAALAAGADGKAVMSQLKNATAQVNKLDTRRKEWNQQLLEYLRGKCECNGGTDCPPCLITRDLEEGWRHE